VIPLLCSKPKEFVSFCLGVLFLALLCIVPCGGQEAEIESVIPAYSVAYVAVEDVPGIWDTVQASSSWMSVLSLEKLTNEARGVMDRAEKLLGIDLRTLVGVFGSRMAFVKVYVDSQAPPAIIADVEDPEDAAEMIRKIEQTVGRDEEYETRSPAGEYKTVSFSSTRRVGRKPFIWYAFLDNLFVIAFDQDTFEAILDVYLGEYPSLLYDPRFNKTRAGISADGAVFVYANMELLWPTVRRSFWFAELGTLLRMLETKSIVWTTNLLASTWGQQMYIYTGEDSELMAPLFAEHGSLLSPHIIPAANGDIFFAVHVGDPVAAWERFGNVVKSVIGEFDYAQMQSKIAAFERDTALSLRNDIMSSLTGEIGFATPGVDVRWIEVPSYLMKKGLLVFFGVKDRELCAMSIERILLTAGGQLQQTEYGGITIYHDMPVLSGRNSPAGYIFAGDLLIFGSIQTLQSIIDEEAPLVVSERFANTNSQLPQRLGLMYYMDLERMGQLFPGASADIPLEDNIMSLQTLGSTGGTLVYDGNGLKIETVGTASGNWLEAMGILAELFVYTLR